MSKTMSTPTSPGQATRAGVAKTYIAIRIRGTVGITAKTADTLKMLRLHRPNVAVLLPDDPSHRGMIQKVKDYIAYGELDAATAAELLEKRGRVVGDAPLSDAAVAKGSGGKYASIQAFAAAIAKGEARVKDLGEDVKPFFRLHPPRGGHEGTIRHHFTVGGVLGYQGKEINALVRRMM